MSSLIVLNILLTVGLGVWVASLARRVHLLYPSTSGAPAPDPHQTTLDKHISFEKN